MSAPLSDRVRAYLDQHATLNLATTGPAGLWSAAVLYVHDGGCLYFTTMATSRHGQNLVATGAGVGTINDECTSWETVKGVQLEGAIAPVTDVEELTRIAAAYLARFPFLARLWAGVRDPIAIARAPGTHGFFRITPTRMYFTDHEHGPGGREEVSLTRTPAT